MGFLPDLEYDVCATIRDVRDGSGLRIVADRVCGPFDAYDMVILPGGFGTRTLVDDGDFIGWIRTADAARTSRRSAPVRCSGARPASFAGAAPPRTTTQRACSRSMARHTWTSGWSRTGTWSPLAA